jgi:nanoRNase/pAp phosphatase (c-di-AMP/oligoRNAs hydrolase)
VDRLVEGLSEGLSEGSSKGSTRRRRSDRLLAAVDGHRAVVVVAHDFPDPDAIAAGWALAHLIRSRTSLPCRLVAGGDVVRGENRELVRLLGPPLELLSSLELQPRTATILVDCAPDARNHLLSRQDVVPTANIDHHRSNARGGRLAFRDLRASAAATVSIAASYLKEQAVEPGESLATAMLYALRTETQGHETHFSPLDRRMLTWITERAHPGRLARIENAPLRRSHFVDLTLALEQVRTHDDVALCMLPRAEGPEIVAEVADLLARCEGVERVLCAAPVADDVMLSLRTAPDGGDAAALADAALRGLGHSGGHEHRAGGKIEGAAVDGRIPGSLQEKLRERWLAACGATGVRARRLVSRRDILDAL